jgi:hypothetical protein
VRRFLAGEPDDLAWFQDWLRMIRAATAEGKQFLRVRVVNVPLSDYNRFGLRCSELTEAAGEDIRYLRRGEAAGLPDHDYWLFDSRKLALMHFDDADRFLGAEIIDDLAAVVQHGYWRDDAWHRAIRRDEFAVT